MTQEKTIKVLQYIINKCSECPLVRKTNNMQMIVNGQVQKQENKYICSKLNIEVQGNEISNNCTLISVKLEEAEIIE